MMFFLEHIDAMCATLYDKHARKYTGAPIDTPSPKGRNGLESIGGKTHEPNVYPIACAAIGDQ